MLDVNNIKNIITAFNNMKTQIDTISKNYSKLIKLGNAIIYKDISRDTPKNISKKEKNNNTTN